MTCWGLTDIEKDYPTQQSETRVFQHAGTHDIVTLFRDLETVLLLLSI